MIAGLRTNAAMASTDRNPAPRIDLTPREGPGVVIHQGPEREKFRARHFHDSANAVLKAGEIACQLHVTRRLSPNA